MIYCSATESNDWRNSNKITWKRVLASTDAQVHVSSGLLVTAYLWLSYHLSCQTNKLYYVREDHSSGEHRFPQNAIVQIDLTNDSKEEALVTHADFVAAPRVSQDGEKLVWIEWSHPYMVRVEKVEPSLHGERGEWREWGHPSCMFLHQHMFGKLWYVILLVQNDHSQHFI